MNILMVLTSHERLGETGFKTGIWLDGFTTAYYILEDGGHGITLASPGGGDPPVDPRSDDPANRTDTMQRFRRDHAVRALLADTLRLEQVDPADFAAAFVVGGHGSMWDLASDVHCARVLSGLHAAGRPIAMVCHGPAVLRQVVDAHGVPVVRDRNVTGFSNSEEHREGFASIVPFSLQDELIRLGGRYGKGRDGESHVISDGLLITGQNQASAADAARTLLEALR